MSTNPTNGNSGSTFNGNRDEITNVQLNVLEGAVPDNIHGIVYFNTQSGNPNSGGLPFPMTLPDGSPNPDYGTPNLNGDGMVYKIDFNDKGKAIATCRIMKNPAYYADLVTAPYGDPSKEKGAGSALKDGGFDHFKFKNFGLARMNMLLGQKNQLNTALIPTAFDNDEGTCLLVTSDVSRPWKVDPVSLDLVTPVGWNKEWVSGYPKVMQTPLAMFQTTAHPSYDPVTKELFVCNYTKSTENELEHSNFQTMLHLDQEKLEREVLAIRDRHKEHLDDTKAIKELKDHIRKHRHKRRTIESGNIIIKFGAFLVELVLHIISFLFGWLFETKDAVFLYTWDGGVGPGKGRMKQNRLVNEEGEDLQIFQCMHQTSISENYIILMDSSFKFSFDLLVTDPFPNNELLDKFIRELLNKKVLPTTNVWLVDRRDLKKAKHKEKVLAVMIPGESPTDGGIPVESVHFTAEYDDSNDEVVLYTAQNNATCMAEWVRTYDNNLFTREKSDPNFVGNFAVGEMGMNSVGKYVIDTKEMKMKSSIQLSEMGENLPAESELEHIEGPLKNIGANTWGIGLYAFRDFISAEVPSKKIEDIFFVSFGSTPQQLTEFIYRLYKDFPGVPEGQLEKMLKYMEKGVPGSIFSIRTDKLEFTGHYEFKNGELPTTIQYIPCTTPAPANERSASQDGYLIVTIKAPVDGIFKAQLWLFEAWDVSKGPVCILNSKDLNFCTTLHSTWIPKAEKLKSGYKVDIVKDFNYMIRKSFIFFEKSHYKKFFNKFIYKHFR